MSLSRVWRVALERITYNSQLSKFKYKTWSPNLYADHSPRSDSAVPYILAYNYTALHTLHLFQLPTLIFNISSQKAHLCCLSFPLMFCLLGFPIFSLDAPTKASSCRCSKPRTPALATTHMCAGRVLDHCSYCCDPLMYSSGIVSQNL